MSDNTRNPVLGLHHRLAYIDSTLRHALGSVSALQESLQVERRADGSMAAELYYLDHTLIRLEHFMQKTKQDPGSLQHAPAAESLGDSAEAERQLLLQALEAQENRIRQLEQQLNELSNDDERLIDNSARHADVEKPSVITNDSLEDDPFAQRMIVTIQDDGNLKIALNRDITTIGREPGNDIQIRSRYVSRYHARIVSDKDGASIEDLDSRNGIAVNAERVSRKQLQSGDFIKIGRVQLQYIDIMQGGFDGGAA